METETNYSTKKIQEGIASELVDRFLAELRGAADWLTARQLCARLRLPYGDGRHTNSGGGRVLRALVNLALKRGVAVVSGNKGYRIAKTREDVNGSIARLECTMSSLREHVELLHQTGLKTFGISL